MTRPFLIVVPLSTLHNWVREFKIWCPEARVVVYSTSKASNTNCESGRSICRQHEFFYSIDASKNPTLAAVKIPKFNVILTPYHYLVSDFLHFA